MKKILNYTNLLFFSILFIAFICRVYALGTIPAGLTNDEADIGYDAFSILLTGRDQWGEYIPVTSFKGFGDYRLPIYTYLVVPVVAIFDLTAFSVRLPSAVFGVISVALVFFVSQMFFKKSEIPTKLVAFSSMFFMAISPWAIGLSRIGIESNVAISFFLLAILLFFHSLKFPKLIVFSFISFALTLYVYTSYSVFTFLTVTLLIFYFRKQLMHFKKYVFFSVLLFVLIVFPLFVFRSAVGVRTSQVLFINSQASIGLMADLNDRRGSCQEVFPQLLCKVSENKQTVFLNTFIKNYVNHFSPAFLYLNGTNTQFSILPQRGLLFAFGLLFLLSGVIAILKKKIKNGMLLLIFLLLSPLPDATTGDGHFSRAANMQPFIFLTEGVGFSYLLYSFKNWKIKYLLAIFTGTLIIGSFVFFLLSYFSYFPKFYSRYGHYGYQNLVEMLNSNKAKYDRIYVSKFSNDTKQYIYYLFYNKYSPKDFQNKEQVKYSDDNGWVSVDQLENIYFVDRIPSEKELEKLSKMKVLIIGHPSEFIKEYQTSNTILDKNGNGIFTSADASKYFQYLKSQRLQEDNL